MSMTMSLGLPWNTFWRVFAVGLDLFRLHSEIYLDVFWMDFGILFFFSIGVDVSLSLRFQHDDLFGNDGCDDWDKDGVDDLVQKTIR